MQAGVYAGGQLRTYDSRAAENRHFFSFASATTPQPPITCANPDSNVFVPRRAVVFVPANKSCPISPHAQVEFILGQLEEGEPQLQVKALRLGGDLLWKLHREEEGVSSYLRCLNVISKAEKLQDTARDDR